MSLLDERELTAEERAAIADEPRPGVWFQPPDDRDDLRLTGVGDFRTLTQDQTDRLIVFEIQRRIEPSEATTLAALVGVVGGRVEFPDGHRAGAQRGGIHSEPAVRLFAFRVWGDRDRRWFELRLDQRAFIDERGFVSPHRPPSAARAVGWVHAGPYADGTVDIRSTEHRSASTVVTRYRIDPSIPR